MIKSRSRAEAIFLPENRSQMYIGLKQTIENLDGSVSETIIPFDPTFINGKVDYFTNGILQGRLNLADCNNQENFDVVVSTSSSGLTSADFANLKCIAPETFLLYNDAQKSLSNSITLTFEQCGGRYTQ